MRKCLLPLGVFLLLLSCELPLRAQQTSNPDNPSEFAQLGNSCNSFTFSKIGSCAELLFTGKPLHVAVGSLSPQNGFGAGLAYVGILKPSNEWRPSFNADAVATPNGSWRAGVYFKFVHTPDFTTTVHYGPPPHIKWNLTELPEHTVVNVYAQAESLNKLMFFGLGPNSLETARTYFGMREVITGANVVKPFSSKLNAALLGEVNGRFVSIRPADGNPSPTIGSVYNDTTAPGLSSQPGFLQLGETVRMRPVLWDDHLHFDDELNYQQFFAPTSSNFSFERLTLDLSETLAIYHSTTRIIFPRDANGPDECAIAPFDNHQDCTLNKTTELQYCKSANPNDAGPCKAISRDLQGSINFRFLLSTSFTPGGDVVPFYFQPTLGGGDLNGDATLGSYQDYRFRAPNVMLLHEAFEHSIWGPIGFALSADEGKVALARGNFGSSPWLHSFAAGLTLRAGNYPQVFLLFAWGGSEGTHTIANVNTSLLGGSLRPSLY